MTCEMAILGRAILVDPDDQAVVLAQLEALEDAPPHGAEVELQAGATVRHRGLGSRARRIAGRLVVDLRREVARHEATRRYRLAALDRLRETNPTRPCD